MRLVAVSLAVVAVSTSCGSMSSDETTTTTAAPPSPAAAVGGHTLYRGGSWAVVVTGGRAVALRLVGDAWKPDRSGRVKVSFLGPHAKSVAMPQVAATISAKSPLVESALWVDGVELLEKGGGLSPKNGTIYGAPAAALAPGKHLAVAYARTATAATAVARAFTVR
jgi:hypothetical protein